MDWSDGDVVFMNSTCFDEDLMVAVSKQAEKLAPGAIVITFTKSLSNAAPSLGPNSVNPKPFEILDRKRYKMSWGPATGIIIFLML